MSKNKASFNIKCTNNILFWIGAFYRADLMPAYGRIPPNQLYECATQLICLTERSGTLP